MGEGGDVAPFPKPFILLEDAKTLLRKRKLCPKKLCQLRGSPQALGNNLETIGPKSGPKSASSAGVNARRINKIAIHDWSQNLHSWVRIPPAPPSFVSLR